MPELRYLGLADKMQKSPSEIMEQWSERDVNLMLFYYSCRSLAEEPDDQKFFRELAAMRITEDAA
jgi:hypothetical protein